MASNGGRVPVEWPLIIDSYLEVAALIFPDQDVADLDVVLMSVLLLLLLPLFSDKSLLSR